MELFLLKFKYDFHWVSSQAFLDHFYISDHPKKVVWIIQYNKQHFKGVKVNDFRSEHGTLLCNIHTCPLLFCPIIAPCCSVAGRWCVLLRILHMWLYLCLLRPYRRPAGGQIPLSLSHAQKHTHTYLIAPVESLCDFLKLCMKTVSVADKNISSFWHVLALKQWQLLSFVMSVTYNESMFFLFSFFLFVCGEKK